MTQPQPPAAEQPAGAELEKLTPEQWSARYDVEIRDPDGWRGRNDPAWDEPITLPDFAARARRSTVRNVGSPAWQRIATDARRAARHEPPDEQAAAPPADLDEAQAVLDATFQAAAELSAENAELRGILAEVLRTFRRPGQHAVCSDWVPEATLERWRATLQTHTPPPIAARPPGPAKPADAAADDVGRLDEIWLVDDQEHNDPGVWSTEADAFERALSDARTDWDVAMAGSPARFTLRAFGDPEDPSYEVMIRSEDIGGTDSTGITIRRLNVNGPQLRPEDVWAPARWGWGAGTKSDTGGVMFISPLMSQVEARRRVAELRRLFPEAPERNQLLRWRIGPALAVHDDKGSDQENPEPTSGSSTDNETKAESQTPET